MPFGMMPCKTDNQELAGTRFGAKFGFGADGASYRHERDYDFRAGSQSGSQLFHGPAPRSPLHRLTIGPAGPNS